jgi:hypothetical protein
VFCERKQNKTKNKTKQKTKKNKKQNKTKQHNAKPKNTQAGQSVLVGYTMKHGLYLKG